MPGSPGRSASAEGRIPDFYIVGHQKCGTTALYEMLRRHPEIYLPEAKEPWFFADELRERTPPRPMGTPATLAEYEAWFAGARAEQRVGEASAQYLWSQTAARGIAEVCPDARIIAIVREPASFLRSLHLQFVQTQIESESDFARALALEESRREGRNVPRYTYWPRMLWYSDQVRYVEQLRRYHALFPSSHVKVLTYDEFRSDNERAVRGVLRFLDLDDSVPVEPVQANPTVQPRSQRLHDLVHALGVGRGPISRAIKETIKALTPGGPRRTTFYSVQRHLVFRSPRPPDSELMRRLQVRFKPEVIALSEYLDRDLVSLWGYDEID